MNYWACGKLLITAEYSILRGSVGLSLPTKFGQHLNVNIADNDFLSWQSKDADGNIWFEASYTKNFKCLQTTDAQSSSNLLNLLKTARNLNPAFNPFGYFATTELDFNAQWGLGSSSTLVALIAKWAKIDALELFFKTSTGSGYDVATAMAQSPILYTLLNGEGKFSPCTFNPPFKNSLYFLYLGKKKRSRGAVLAFEKNKVSTEVIEEISSITRKILACQQLSQFEDLIRQHEAITSRILNYPTIKSQFFPEYPNAIKSLGAWGGDFVLLVCPSGDLDYFREKGYSTILSWQEMFGA